MTNQELQKLVEEISLTRFGRPFIHQAIFNARLKTTGGRYHLQDHHLDFNPGLFAQVEEEVRRGIIVHELCHYHLHLTKRGYRHKDREFKELLQATKGLRYAPRIDSPERKPVRKLYYCCQDCGQEYIRQRRIDTKKYRCGRCRGPLVFLKSSDV